MDIYHRVLNHCSSHTSFTETLELLHGDVVEKVKKEQEEGKFDGDIKSHPAVVLLVSELSFHTVGHSSIAKQVCAELSNTDEYNHCIIGDTDKTKYAPLYEYSLTDD